MRRLIALLLVLAALASLDLAAEPPALPNRTDSLKMAVIGDNGTGDDPQYEVAGQMAAARSAFPFDLVLMVGDNFYGSQKPKDLVEKFERPYAPLLQAGVRFQAALGNHDAPESVHYPPLNMNGQRYYAFTRKNVRFFVLDTNALDAKQLEWFRTVVSGARGEWKVCIFHHPLYGNAGRHGAAVDIRLLLEPILVEHGVHVVFSGHDHVYERLKPQKGIHYFVTGAGGKLRKGDIEASESTAAAFDQDQSFMLVEIAGDELFFRTVSRTGRIVDGGVIRRTGPELTIQPTAGPVHAAGSAAGGAP
jgi:Calcineurin-like phosphoesterase